LVRDDARAAEEMAGAAQVIAASDAPQNVNDRIH
jgi:hypothetical protein